MQSHKLRTVMGCAVVALATATGLRADTATPAADAALVEKIKQLEQRVAELEGKTSAPPAAAEAPAATPAPSGLPEKMLAFLGQTDFSGFVSASYLYDFSKPGNSALSPGSEVPLRTFDRQHNEFMLNKLKIALDNPAEASGEHWDAGFRADVIVGQDADVIQSLGLFDDPDGEFIDLEQAYVAVNVPVGNGLQFKLGKMVTLMGVEVIEEVANPNWSEGNQFLLVENFTMLGALASYKFNDHVDMQAGVFNGWDVVKDNNNGKSFMGRLGFTMDETTSLGVVGYAGPEQASNTSNLRSGVNLVFNKRFTDKFNSYVQLDYGHEDGVTLSGGDAEWYAAGLWLVYDFTERVGLAFRGDYLRDSHGVRIGTLDNTELWSATLTLNWKPIANLQVRPEIRYDRAGGQPDVFAGAEDRITLGLGVAYLF